MPALTPIVVLAAGGSARLGHPKQLVEIGGRSLLARAIAAASASGGGPVYVVLGAHRQAIVQATPELAGCIAVVCPDWEQGMSASLRAGVSAVLGKAPDASATLIVACDQPAVTGEHLAALLASHQTHPEAIVASEYAGRLGIPALFPRRTFPELLALTGDAGARELLRSGSEAVIAVPLPRGEWDIDTQKDIGAS